MSSLKCKPVLAVAMIASLAAVPSAAMAQGAVVGTLLGGALGGLAGSAIGHGGGQAAAIVAGVAIGSAIGGSVGAHADYAAGRPPFGPYPPGGYYHYPPASGAYGEAAPADVHAVPSGYYVRGEADDALPHYRAPSDGHAPYGYYRK